MLTLLTVIFGSAQCALDIKYATRWSVLKEVFNQQALFAVLTFGAGILILSGDSIFRSVPLWPWPGLASAY